MSIPTLAALKAERASVASKAYQIETEPIRHVAELIDTDSERMTMADCPHGAVLRCAHHRADGRSFGTAINRA
jgi:hypothetical protein